MLDSDSDDTIIYDYSDYIRNSGVLSNSDSHANNYSDNDDVHGNTNLPKSKQKVKLKTRKMFNTDFNSSDLPPPNVCVDLKHIQAVNAKIILLETVKPTAVCCNCGKIIYPHSIRWANDVLRKDWKAGAREKYQRRPQSTEFENMLCPEYIANYNIDSEKPKSKSPPQDMDDNYVKK